MPWDICIIRQFINEGAPKICPPFIMILISGTGITLFHYRLERLQHCEKQGNQSLSWRHNWRRLSNCMKSELYHLFFALGAYKLISMTLIISMAQINNATMQSPKEQHPRYSDVIHWAEGRMCGPSLWLGQYLNTCDILRWLSFFCRLSLTQNHHLYKEGNVCTQASVVCHHWVRNPRALIRCISKYALECTYTNE